MQEKNDNMNDDNSISRHKLSVLVISTDTCVSCLHFFNFKNVLLLIDLGKNDKLKPFP